MDHALNQLGSAQQAVREHLVQANRLKTEIQDRGEDDDNDG
jgi:hypothetical protein